MEKKINDALDQIRPFLQRDGGDIEFVEYTDDNIVKVRLQGHCAGCPGAQLPLALFLPPHSGAALSDPCICFTY